MVRALRLGAINRIRFTSSGLSTTGATLLFAQFSIQPQRALLALASGYIFSSSFAFLQTLAFPGAYAPAGLIGDANTAAWMCVLWHATFPTAILVYALSKDVAGPATLPGRSTMTSLPTTFVL